MRCVSRDPRSFYPPVAKSQTRAGQPAIYRRSVVTTETWPQSTLAPGAIGRPGGGAGVGVPSGGTGGLSSALPAEAAGAHMGPRQHIGVLIAPTQNMHTLFGWCRAYSVRPYQPTA